MKRNHFWIVPWSLGLLVSSFLYHVMKIGWLVLAVMLVSSVQVQSQVADYGPHSSYMKNKMTIYNVMDKGATDDSTISSEPAFVAAHAALPDSGGIIYAPAGWFLLDSILNITKNNVTIRGAGKNVTYLYIPDDSVYILSSVNRNFQIEDLTIVSRGTGQQLSGMVYFQTNTGGHVKNVRFTGGGNQFRSHTSREFRIVDCDFDSLTANYTAISIWQGGGFTLENVRVHDYSLSNGVGGHLAAVFIQRADHFSISDSRIYDIDFTAADSAGGLTLDSCSYGTITGGTVAGLEGADGILLENKTHNISIVGVNSSGNGVNPGAETVDSNSGTGDGIDIYNSYNIRVSDCIFDNNGTDNAGDLDWHPGIEIWGSSNVGVHNTSASNNGSNGVQIINSFNVSLFDVTASNNYCNGVNLGYSASVVDGTDSLITWVSGGSFGLGWRDGDILVIDGNDYYVDTVLGATTLLVKASGLSLDDVNCYQFVQPFTIVGGVFNDNNENDNSDIWLQNGIYLGQARNGRISHIKSTDTDTSSSPLRLQKYGIRAEGTSSAEVFACNLDSNVTGGLLNSSTGLTGMTLPGSGATAGYYLPLDRSGTANYVLHGHPDSSRSWWDADDGAGGGTTDSFFIVYGVVDSIKGLAADVGGWITPDDSVWVDTTTGALTYFVESDSGSYSALTTDGVNISIAINNPLYVSGALGVKENITTLTGFDAIGAVDLDYGSNDVTDHTFTTDGTGTAEFVLPVGSIDGTEILDATIGIADLAAGVYAKDIVTTAPLTGGTDNVLVGAEGDVTIAMPVATTSADGYLAQTDWDKFNDHADDVTQAHSDYLLNSGSDAFIGNLSGDGLIADSGSIDTLAVSRLNTDSMTIAGNLVTTGLIDTTDIANLAKEVEDLTDDSASWNDHVADNTQAHSDYLLNSGSDAFVGNLSGDGLVADSGSVDTLGVNKITVANAIVISADSIIDFAGTNLSVTAGVLNATGGSGTADSMGIDTDGDGTVDNYLYSTTAGAFHIKEGANITLTVAGDTVTIAGPASGGTADSIGVDTDGDGTMDGYMYSSVAGSAHLKEGTGMILTLDTDTTSFATTLGTTITSSEITDDEIVGADLKSTLKDSITTGYDHTADNTQAHTDYLLNSASDAFIGNLSGDGLIADSARIDTLSTSRLNADSITVAGNIVTTGLIDTTDIANLAKEVEDLTDDSASWNDHVADNTQAHSDYLLNSGSDAFVGNLSGDGIVTDSGSVDTLGVNKITVANAIVISADSIIDFAGTNLSVTAGVLNAASGGATAYDDIGDPDASGSIAMGAHTGTYTTSTDGWGGIIIENTTADLSSSTTLLTLKYTDDGDADSKFLSIVDATNQEKFYIGQHGYLVMGSAGISEPELEIIDGATVTTTELNMLDTDVDPTLQDIADGTIAENLVNTDNPWADNEVADDITIDNATLSDSTGAVVSSDIVMDSIGGPAKFTLSHHFGSTQSACKLTGGAFTNDGGTLDVGAGSGYIKKTNHDTAATYFIDWSSQEDIETEGSVALTDNAVNYIYLSYNSGTPTIFSTVTKTDIDHHTEIGLGRLYKDGTDLHLLEGGVQGQDAIYRLHKRAVNTDGFIRATGMQTTSTDSATLRIEITAGTFWNGLTEFSFSGYESATDSFTIWWHDDGDTWQSDDTGYIPNTQYNNISGADSVLANFVNNQYGIVWVYAHIDGDIHVVYGTDSYTLSEADAATAPNSLPTTISSFSLLVAKIIIQEGEASPAEIATPWGDDISASGVTDHGGLAGLSDDDHPQYTTDANITDTLNSYADTATIKDSLDVIRGEIRDTVNATLHHWGFSIPDPNTYYDTDTIFCVVPLTSAAVTITRIDVTLDADPATEPVLTLKHKDVYIGEANVTAIDVITTAVGVTAITTGFDDATIPASKCVYLSFGADPLAAIKSINVLITYTVD